MQGEMQINANERKKYGSLRQGGRERCACKLFIVSTVWIGAGIAQSV
jgi:hypothetical protein